MGFTIEDMHLISKDRYRMKFEAGRKGWSNSIDWILLLEDMKVISNFAGKELAVTTGLGFENEEKQLELVRALAQKHAAGLIVNIGEYIPQVPQSVIEFCDENDLPLLTVPWEIYLVDMIKDLSIRIFIQQTADEEITRAMIHAIEEPSNRDLYWNELLPYMDVDGDFRAVLLSVKGLDEMDTVERRRLSYRIQIYLENITHNACFFYYDANFVLIMNDVGDEDLHIIVNGVVERAKKRMPEFALHVGVGSRVRSIENMHCSFRRAEAAIKQAMRTSRELVYFDDMGTDRLLYLVPDRELLREMSTSPLAPLIEYDEKHNGCYVDTLEKYLKHGGSIQAIAEETFTHRNTVIYRISNIRKLLGSEIDTPEKRFELMMAYLIREML